MAKTKGKTRYQKINVAMKSGEVDVYASPRVRTALKELLDDMTVYKGVRLAQILEAVYNQGSKDGARNAINTIQGSFDSTIESIPHKNPGRPRKKKG